MIFSVEEEFSNREKVIDLLKELKSKKPDSKVLDFGGGAGSWVGQYADYIVDLQPNFEASNSGKKVILGDGHLDETWSEFGDDFFDFCICTHTLEDVRDPSSIARHLSRVAKAGFVAVPNRHQEFAHHQSPLWRGNLHHRWIFRGSENGLRGSMKTSLLHTSRFRKLSLFLQALPLGSRYKLAISNIAPVVRTPWWRRSLSRFRGGAELSFFWIGSFQVDFILNDMDTIPGEMPRDHALHMEIFLGEPVIQSQDFSKSDTLRILTSHN